MKFASRVLTLLLLLGAISMSLLVTAPEAFAKENVVHGSSPPLHPEVTLTFQPKIGGILIPATFSLNQNGTISVTATPWAIDTPIGIVSLGGSLSASSPPQTSPQAKQVSMSADSLLLIVRHRHGNVLQDSNHQFRAVQMIQGIDIKGAINEVSIKYTGNHFIVFIDASGSNIKNITLQGASTDTTPTVKTCKVKFAAGLNIRAAPTSHSALIAYYLRGTVLNFVQVVNGENIRGNSHWARSKQGHYFWLGGTDHPNG